MKNIATHSAKTTVLSWMSKANVPISLRRLAGYHVKPGDKSALEYSRDAQSPVLHQIEAIYIAIKSGRFCPDAMPSQRWVGCNSLQTAMEATAGDVSSPTPPFKSDATVVEIDDTDIEGVELDLETAAELVSKKFDECFARARQREWNDDTTLRELVPVAFHSSDVDLQVDQSESGEDISSSSPSSSSGDDRRMQFDGDANARHLVAPSDLARLECYVHFKSGKLLFFFFLVSRTRHHSCAGHCFTIRSHCNFFRNATIPPGRIRQQKKTKQTANKQNQQRNTNQTQTENQTPEWKLSSLFLYNVQLK